MNGKTEVIITVGPDGNVTTEVNGHIGKGCQALTESIEQALGEVQEVVFKPEFNRVPAKQGVKVKGVKQTVKTGGGW